MSYYQVCKKSLVRKSLLLKIILVWNISSVYAQCLKEPAKKISAFLRKFLTAAILCTIVYGMGQAMTIREAIQEELQWRGWSHYRLTKELEGKMPARTVYAYIGGDCDLVSERASIILETLGLTITTGSAKRTHELKMHEKIVKGKL